MRVFCFVCSGWIGWIPMFDHTFQQKFDVSFIHKYFFLFFLNLFFYLFILFFTLKYCICFAIHQHLPWVYMCSSSWTPLPPPSPYHPSGSSQCTSPKPPASCIESGLAIHFLYDIIHVSMPFSQIIPRPSPTESKRLFYTSFKKFSIFIRKFSFREALEFARVSGRGV